MISVCRWPAGWPNTACTANSELCWEVFGIGFPTTLSFSIACSCSQLTAKSSFRLWAQQRRLICPTPSFFLHSWSGEYRRTRLIYIINESLSLRFCRCVYVCVCVWERECVCVCVFVSESSTGAWGWTNFVSLLTNSIPKEFIFSKHRYVFRHIFCHVCIYKLVGGGDGGLPLSVLR